jgi:hypothetical protein
MSDNFKARQQAIAKLWEKGHVSWKLDSCQKKLYQTFKNTNYKTTVFVASRRIGKTTTLLTLALEHAFQNPNSQVKYGAPTAKMVKKMIEPTLKMLMADCPKDLMPKYDRNEGVYNFKNGSKLFIEGLNEGNAENLRGTSLDLGIVDEAGFVDDLKYVVGSILLPQALTTKGKLVLASTPPISPEHDFVQIYMLDAQNNGAYIKKSIYDYLDDVKDDPPHLKNRIPREELDAIKAATGGEDSVAFRREYLCHILTDANSAVVPEFEKIKESVLGDSKIPAQYHSYVSIDFGYEDFHGVLFAYYDFVKGKLVVIDEILVKGKDCNSEQLSKLIKNKERVLWQNEFGEPIPVYRRVADDDMVTIKDLNELHNLYVIPTKKDQKQAAVNELRVRLVGGYVEINPRCEKLITQLESGIWANYRDGSLKTTFARTRDSGHFDLLDAFIYLVRNVDWQARPKNLTTFDADNNFSSNNQYGTGLTVTQKTLQSIFAKKKPWGR